MMEFPPPPPADVVPPPGLTIEALRQLNDMVGREVVMSTPGRVLCDPDGIPIGIEPGETVLADLASPVISASEIERLGIDPNDFPNIVFATPNPNERTAP